jgi:hypothetical protein
MRTIGFRSNILFAIAAACGIIAALGRPWYGPEIPGEAGSVENLGSAIGRALTESGGTDGWAALESADRVLAGLAIGTVVLVMLALAPALQRHVQALSRWTALAAVGVVLAKLIDAPDTAAMAEPRNGLFLALASALVLLASTWTVSAAPPRRRTPPKTYTPPPAPAYKPDSSYGPPQF